MGRVCSSLLLGLIGRGMNLGHPDSSFELSEKVLNQTVEDDVAVRNEVESEFVVVAGGL